MNTIPDDVMHRLAPAILEYADANGIPFETIATPGAISVAVLVEGDAAVIHVSLLDDRGAHPLMKLHPATHGLKVVDGQLVVDDFEV